jgi:hypothetical protein
MQEIILPANTLPEPLSALIHAEKVRVQEVDGIIKLIPLKEVADCTDGLFGIFSDGKMSSDKFSEMKQAEKSLEI